MKFDLSNEKLIKSWVKKELKKQNTNKYSRMIFTILSTIPWIGSYSAMLSSYNDEKQREALTDLQIMWLEEHGKKIDELRNAIEQIVTRLDNFGDEITERINSDEYQTLVSKGFKIWDRSETSEKKTLIRKLLTNAGAHTIVDDDLVRLFLDWIDNYHEAHFGVIKEIYKNPGITRARIWENINPSKETPRDDSAEADLFKLLIYDLSTGRVARQSRATNEYGQFVNKTIKSRKSPVAVSAFEDGKPYVLTKLGEKFVHYVLEDVVPVIKD